VWAFKVFKDFFASFRLFFVGKIGKKVVIVEQVAVVMKFFFKYRKSFS